MAWTSQLEHTPYLAGEGGFGRQNMNLLSPPSLKLVQMPVRVADLAFDFFVLYYRQPMYPTVPSPVKNTGKEGDCKSNRICTVTSLSTVWGSECFPGQRTHTIYYCVQHCVLKYCTYTLPLPLCKRTTVCVSESPQILLFSYNKSGFGCWGGGGGGNKL